VDPDDYGFWGFVIGFGTVDVELEVDGGGGFVGAGLHFGLGNEGDW